MDLSFPPILNTSTTGNAVAWEILRAYLSKTMKARFVKKGIKMFLIPGYPVFKLGHRDLQIGQDQLSTTIND